jgi:hypothetical protein
MMRRLPEVLSMITVCCLIGMAAGCPTEPPKTTINKISTSTKTSSASYHEQQHRMPVRAAQPRGIEPIGCRLNDR